MVDEPTMSRWLSLDLSGIAMALVTATRPLADVVAGDAPTARTRAGQTHVFDPAAARRLFDALPPLARRRLRVPVTFWVDKDVPDSAFVQEDAAAAALVALGRVPADRASRDGRAWLGRSLAADVARAYPTLFQFAYF